MILYIRDKQTNRTEQTISEEIISPPAGNGNTAVMGRARITLLVILQEAETRED